MEKSQPEKGFKLALVVQDVTVCRDESCAPGLEGRVDMQRISPIRRANDSDDLWQVRGASEVVSHPSQLFPGRVEVSPLRIGGRGRRRNVPCPRSGVVGKMDQLDPPMVLERAKLGSQGTVLAVDLHLEIRLTLAVSGRCASITSTRSAAQRC